MSQRHYIEVLDADDNNTVFSAQILGNNDYFDEEFYDHMGIVMDEGCCFDIEIKDFAGLLLEWHKYLERHPEMKGLPNSPTSVIATLKDDTELLKEYVYLHYVSSNSYEMQLFEVTKKLSPFLNYKGIVKAEYTLRFVEY